MIKKFFVLALFSCSANAFSIPDNLQQGMFVFGTAEADEKIFYEDIEVPVYNGKYVFALGRNAPQKIQITVKKGWFEKKILNFSVKERTWKKNIFDGVPENTVKPSKEEKERIAKEQKILDEARKKKYFKSEFPERFYWPVEGRISSPFGAERIINGVKQSSHSGVDIAAPMGADVKATADGMVVLAENDLFYTGGTILMAHGGGIVSGYSHLSELTVKNGDIVKVGDVIGKVGATGRATGPHLHFTLSWENIRVAPEFVCESCCPDGDE